MEIDELKLKQDWFKLRLKLKLKFGRLPDMNAVLFLIGMNEVGQIKKVFSKEEKQDLMHVAVCVLLSRNGYYEFEKNDEDGWPHYKPTSMLPKMNLEEQELLLKINILHYFENQNMN